MIEENSEANLKISEPQKNQTQTKRKFSFKVNLRKFNQKNENLENNNEKNNEEKQKLTIRKLFRKSSIKKLITNVQRRVTSEFSFTSNQSKGERVPPINGYVWPPDTTPGVIGLRNHGNTCFMNAVLQCLSHTDILAEYFVLDQYKADLRKRNKLNSRKFGTKGELTEQLALVLKALWTCKDAPEYSTSFKAVVDRYGSQFRSSTQHDAQEFLLWLLDKVHEDLNTATKKKYKTIKNNGRPDEVIAAETLANYVRCNNSFVQAVFQAQFRSSLTCPQCHKQSNTFDPFHCVSVQLPQLTKQSVIVNVLYNSQQPKQVKFGLGIPHGSSIVALREQLQSDTGIDSKRIILSEITVGGFGRIFCDSHPLSSIKEDDSIFCIESPKDVDETSQIILCILNVSKQNEKIERFSTPICLKVNRDVSFTELQKLLLKEMSAILKSEVFTYSTPISSMFKIHLQDPSADPDTYLEPNVEHPLFTEMIDLALSVQPSDSGPAHIKLLLEWTDPEKYFTDMSDPFVEHESVTQLKEKKSAEVVLTLEQCLDHYTKAETLSAEDAWRCPHCQKYLPVVKTLGLWSLPDILVIHFKRFRQQQLKGPQASKLTTMVEFPLTGFDMSPHLARNIEKSPNNPPGSPKKKPTIKKSIAKIPTVQEDCHYDLYAVCYHQGDTLETGHYTAACKNPYDQLWYKFDDQRVSKVDTENVHDEIINNEAYMLFYQRRKADSSECSGASSSSEHWVSKITTAPTVKPTTLTQTSNTTTTTSVTAVTNSVPTTVLNSVKEPPPEEKQDDETNKTPAKAESSPEPPIIPIIPKLDVNLDEIEAIDSDVVEPEITEMADDKTILEVVEESPKQLSESGSKTLTPALTPVQELSPAKANGNKINVVVDIVPNSIEKDEPEIPEEPTEIEEEKEKEEDQVQIRKEEKKIKKECDKIEELMSQQAINNLLWDDTNIQATKRPDMNFRISDLINIDNAVDLTTPSSTSLPKNYMLKECDAISMIRGVSSCSKDTLLFIDQPGHGLLNSEENGLLDSNRSLWISPVTPHKLITVSPKN